MGDGHGTIFPQNHHLVLVNHHHHLLVQVHLNTLPKGSDRIITITPLNILIFSKHWLNCGRNSAHVVSLLPRISKKCRASKVNVLVRICIQDTNMWVIHHHYDPHMNRTQYVELNIGIKNYFILGPKAALTLRYVSIMIQCAGFIESNKGVNV